MLVSWRARGGKGEGKAAEDGVTYIVKELVRLIGPPLRQVESTGDGDILLETNHDREY
jgi:hypothetical protein